jgi:G:T-mismatch repair DNA endonuclease (very short patch repair protein)
MTDHLDKAKRSWNMSRIRGKNTKPEIAVRKLLQLSRCKPITGLGGFFMGH